MHQQKAAISWRTKPFPILFLLEMAVTLDWDEGQELREGRFRGSPVSALTAMTKTPFARILAFSWGNRLTTHCSTILREGYGATDDGISSDTKARPTRRPPSSSLTKSTPRRYVLRSRRNHSFRRYFSSVWSTLTAPTSLALPRT